MTNYKERKQTEQEWRFPGSDFFYQEDWLRMGVARILELAVTLIGRRKERKTNKGGEMEHNGRVRTIIMKTWEMNCSLKTCLPYQPGRTWSFRLSLSLSLLPEKGFPENSIGTRIAKVQLNFDLLSFSAFFTFFQVTDTIVGPRSL